MSSITKPFKELSLAERLKRNKKRPIILADTSSSMNEEVEPDVTKYEAMCNILKNLSGSPTVWGFDYDVNPTNINDLSKGRGHGGTHLSPALRLMKERGLKEAVVITDGDVNSEDREETLRQAEGILLKVIYVGPANSKPAFIEDLANKSGGFCDVEDLRQTEELTGKIQILIGPGPEDTTIKL